MNEEWASGAVSMSLLKDNETFEQYVKLCGSRFAATTFLADKARQLAEKYQNVITHAEALHWILSGETPDNIINYDKILQRRKQRSQGAARLYLSNILDENIRTSVLKSLSMSKKAGHLIYYYDGIYEPERKARVRVLTRELWDSC